LRTERSVLVLPALALGGLWLGLAGSAAAQPGVTGPGDVQWRVTEPLPPPPPVLRRFQVALGGALRFTGLDPHADASEQQLREYGWQSAISPVMPTLAIDAQYLLAPLVDVGVAIGWSEADHAAGLDQLNDRVTTSTTQVALVGRLHWAMGRPFVPEPRLDVGVVRREIALHGVAATDSLPYLRAGIDWRLGTRRAGVQLALGYTVSGRASGEQLDPAVGGLDVGLGPFMRF